MADVYNYIVPTGTVTTDTGVILTEVQDEYKNTFGQDLIVTPETPQGALIVSEALARDAAASNNAALANQINPNIAGGVYLDAIMALTGTQRTPATRSLVECTIAGVPGTSIPAGSQASESGSGNENLFQTVQTVVIPVGGSLSGVVFESVVPGPIPANAGTLTQIISNVLGWESVTNPNAAVLGQETQSDVSARSYRREALFTQGVSLPGAIMASVLRVQGVTSISFRENVASTIEVIDGITMLPHSIYVCVYGSGFTNEDVAQAILDKKSGGAGFTNNASADPQGVVVVDPYSGQSITVLFDIANPIQIAVLASVSASTSIQDPESAVKQAILEYAAGAIDGEPGFVIGAPVSCFELAGAVNIISPGIFVHNLQTKKVVGGSFANTEIPIEVFEIATIISSDITVNVV